MGLTLGEIIKGIINEGVSTDEVLDAIRNRRYVRIKYDDKKKGNHGNPRGSRVIQPFAVGTTKSGHPVVRAFQTSPNSRKGAPNWKFFRLDRIEKWQPYKKKTFNSTPDSSFGVYNTIGDDTMGTFIDNVKFLDPNSPLAKVKQGYEDMINAPKVSTKNAKGPIAATNQRKQNVFTSQPNSKKWAEYAKNVDNTERKGEDFWKLFDLGTKGEQDQEELDYSYNSGPIQNNGYDEDTYDVDDVDFDENNFITNKNKR